MPLLVDASNVLLAEGALSPEFAGPSLEDLTSYIARSRSGCEVIADACRSAQPNIRFRSSGRAVCVVHDRGCRSRDRLPIAHTRQKPALMRDAVSINSSRSRRNPNDKTSIESSSPSVYRIR